MNPDHISFNALMFGPRNSEKTRFLVDLLSTTFRRKFYYIVLLCKTFTHNITYDCFGENDKDLPFLTPLQDQIDNWLKINSYLYEGTNTLIILTDCTASRDMKQRMDELVSLAFSARHRRIWSSVYDKEIDSTCEETDSRLIKRLNKNLCKYLIITCVRNYVRTCART